jgi:hypothetical protein
MTNMDLSSPEPSELGSWKVVSLPAAPVFIYKNALFNAVDGY